MLASRGGHVATLLSAPEGHEGNVGLLAADHAEDGAGNVAQVLPGQAHDRQVRMTSASKEQFKDGQYLFSVIIWRVCPIPAFLNHLLYPNFVYCKC